MKNREKQRSPSKKRRDESLRTLAVDERDEGEERETEETGWKGKKFVTHDSRAEIRHVFKESTADEINRTRSVEDKN